MLLLKTLLMKFLLQQNNRILNTENPPSIVGGGFFIELSLRLHLFKVSAGREAFDFFEGAGKIKRVAESGGHSYFTDGKIAVF